VLDSRATVCAPVLDVSCFVDHASPFQSARLSIARAPEALAINTTTPPRIRRVRAEPRFLTAP